jgi:hypothetical protein
MDRAFAIENARERERLKSFVTRLKDAQLSQSIDGRWTIAVALAHLAFWDQRSLCLMRKWKSSGVVPFPIDFDLANESLLPLWQALSPRAAANLAVSSAEAIDRELEAAPADLIAEIEKLGERFRLYRSEHRKLHLDEMEEVLKRLDSADQV